jgi:hypothetical protein
MTHEEEFYPDVFLEPLRAAMEFQEAIVHTQLFVSFFDKLRKESVVLNGIRFVPIVPSLHCLDWLGACMVCC